MKKVTALIGWVISVALFVVSCAEYTPKPRGYFRIEPTKAEYQDLAVENLPFDFSVSTSAIVELSVEERHCNELNISYPELSAKIYCSYLPITRSSLASVEKESRSFIVRQLKPETRIAEKAYENSEANVYGSLFLLEGDLASPIQFLLTDSVSHFFRGALYFDCRPNVDSLAPAIQYIREDIVELIQTFSWRE